MSDFPALNPQGRTYTPGAFAALSTNTMAGSHITVRRTNAAVNHRLSLTFASNEVDDHNAIYIHYLTQNRFAPFDIPASILAGSNISLPSNYQFIYAKAPDVTYEPDLITVSVELQLVPSYSI